MFKPRALFGFINLRKKLSDYVAKGNFDMTFLVLVIILLCFGLVMLFSASYVSALHAQSTDRIVNAIMNAVNKMSSKKFTASDFYPYTVIIKQAVFAAVGIVLMFIVSKIRYDVFKDFAVLTVIISIILLIVVLFTHVKLQGREEIARTLNIPFIGPFQPSELGKLGLIMFCAWGMSCQQKQIAKNSKLLILYIAVIALMCGLVFAESHLSGTILIFCIGAVMLFLSGAKMRWFIAGGIILLLIGIAGVFCMWLIVNKPDEARKFLPERIVALGTVTSKTSYMMIRIIAWLNKNYDPMNARWQINQSLYAISSGGFFGKGLGESIQKYLFLSEAQNDFIFAIICEELGFAGACAVITLFCLLVWRGFVIAIKSNDRFSSLLVMGIVFQVGLQTALHIAVVTDTVPNTGISLPFFSAGGSAMLILFIEMGMVLSVSRYSKMKKS
jgi:cell division protein FtsW